MMHCDQDIYEARAKNTSLAELVEFYDQLVPPVYRNRFPLGFHLSPSDWHLAAQVIHRKKVPLGLEHIRAIGTLDVEFLSNEIIMKARAGTSLARQYPCGMKCPGCFSEDVTYLDAARLLTWQEVFKVIDDARRIDLSTLKFLGPGELFQNPDLFEILDAAESRSLPISIFTKGAELGDDELAKYIYGHLGIRSAPDLIARVAEYQCVRILLGFNSFDPIKQDLMVGSHGITGHYQVNGALFVKRGVERYTAKRNRALMNLVSVGFNRPEAGQKLSLIAAPVGLDQTEEIVEMYVWAARRNMPLVIAPTMESGPRAIGLMRSNTKKDPNHEKLKRMYVAVYSRAVEEGITDLETVEHDGVSAYMGTASCNQVANGLYLRLNGQVQICPGASRGHAILGNVHERSIVQIWKESSNYELGELENNWCVAKTHGMPPRLQNEVLRELKERFGSRRAENAGTKLVSTRRIDQLDIPAAH